MAEPTPKDADLRVSVIVPVRNGGRDLPELIAALEKQTLARTAFEVLIADDGSTDGSSDGLDTNDGWLRVLRGPPRNSYAARNRGVAASSAPFLAFCDADCRPDPDWLESGLAALERSPLAAGLIKFIVPDRPSAWALLHMDLSKDQERWVREGRGETANLFAHRRAFEAVSGFDDSLPSGGDTDFVTRCISAGMELRFAQEAVVWHPARDRARTFLRAIWRVQRARGARVHAAHSRYRPPFLQFSFVPILGMMRSRRRSGLSLRLDRRKLALNGYTPTVWDELRALPLMYLLLPCVACTANVVGWREARRRRLA